MSKVQVGVLILAALAAAEPAQGQNRGEWTRAIALAENQHFDVVGIRIGMAPAEVASVMQAAGYRAHQSGSGPSWETAVSRLVPSRSVRSSQRTEVPSWQSFVKGAEAVEVQFWPTPAGAAVGEVSYTVNADVLSAQRFREALTRRYGRSGWDNGIEFQYCSPGERACNLYGFLDGFQLPGVFAVAGPMQHRIRLTSGARAVAAHEAALRAEVDRRTPQMARPTF